MGLNSIFNGATKLPTVPKIVQELIKSFEDPDVKVDDLTKKIAMDPALTVKLLRMANSSYFGSSRDVSSVSDAVIILGFNRLRTLVLASGITGAFDYPESFDKNLFWKSSFESAAICKSLAKYGSADAETAFTCGMLGDIGTILILTTFPEEMGSILEQTAKGANRRDLEQTAFDFTATEVSAGLAKLWRFPDAIVNALRWQDEPKNSDDSTYAFLLSISNFIQEKRIDLTHEQLCDTFPLALAKGANLNTDKLLKNMDSVIEVDSVMDGLLD